MDWQGSPRLEANTRHNGCDAERPNNLSGNARQFCLLSLARGNTRGSLRRHSRLLPFPPLIAPSAVAGLGSPISFWLVSRSRPVGLGDVALSVPTSSLGIKVPGPLP